MAQKVTVTKIDDLDGSIEGNESNGIVVETIEFGLDGVVYEIDLGPENATRLRAVLADHKEAGHKLTGIGAKRSANARRASTSDGPDAKYTAAQRKEIREWCIRNGPEDRVVRLGERGRLPLWAFEAFEAKDPSKLELTDAVPVG